MPPRGVDVTVIMTSDSEWDSAFAQLESAGVHVVLYPDTSSARYVHAKVIDVDGTRAFVGSENFSTASFDYNRELGLITSARAVVGPLNSTLLSDASGSQQQVENAHSPPAGTDVSPSCSVGLSNPLPSQGTEERATITSNQPDAGVTLSKHFKTTTSTDTGMTDANGGTYIRFDIGSATSGFTVSVVASVGAATCSTSFTTA
jgi:hypothetical protein